MLKYLSIASEKVKYLAFYDRGEFVGAINIGTVISGLSSNNDEFRNFGEKIKSGRWENFPGLIKQNHGFSEVPSVKSLYEFLTSNNLSEAPLVKNGKLLGFLNYKSISNELYSQAASS